MSLNDSNSDRSLRASTLLTQSQPNRACARARWKIGQGRLSMKLGRASRCLEAIAGHYFQRMLSQRGAIGREQEVAISLRQIESIHEQFLKIIFNLKRFCSG